MKKMRRTLAMLLVMVLFLGLVGPARLLRAEVYADELAGEKTEEIEEVKETEEVEEVEET